jgi:uncharacterized protein (TIGR02453 family)
MLQPSTIKFLKDLGRNNNKAWLDSHRNAFENAKEDFAAFVQTVLAKLGKKDKTIADLKVKDCTFKQHRDIRFSKDKSPYKDHMGAYIGRGGKKSPFAGYYFHCHAGQSFVGGGLWTPMPPELNKVRQEIDYNFSEFRKIIGSKKFKATYGDLSDDPEYILKRVPKGYEADNPAAEYLKRKSFLATSPISDNDLVSKTLVPKVISAFETLQPLLNFLNRSLE